MIKNYFKVAFRNLINNKVFSVINILGLSIGLTCAILIGLWIYDEVIKDQFHEKEIYQVVVNIKPEGDPLIWTNSPAMFGRVFRENISGIEMAVKVSGLETRLVFYEDKKLAEGGYFADSAFFEVFNYPLLYGDRKTALYGMNSVVVSEKLANRIFNTTNVIGKTIEIEDIERESYTITAVFTVPESSSTKFDFVLPYYKYTLGRPWMSNPGNFNDNTYVTLLPGVEKAVVEKEFSDFIFEIFKDQRNVRNDFYLYPYKDLYLKSNFEKWPVATGRIQYIHLFLIVGLIILVIACINFMNLSTALASKRAKEVGVRKTVGARKSALIAQFIGESFLITFIAMVLALTIADLLMPLFNVLVEKELAIPFKDFQFLGIILAILIITGFISGSYPALYLSSFQAASVLKGEIKKNKSMGGIRRVLVILQFSLSIILIISTIVIYKQLEYIQKKDLGIEREQILMHSMANIGKERSAYRTEIMNIPGVENINMANFNPMMIHNSTNSIDWTGKTEEDDFFFHVIQSDNHFVETFGVDIVAGKDLPDNVVEGDTMRYFLLNETAVRMMELKDPVGAQISVWGSLGIVTGVVGDFHHDKLDKPIEPVVVYRTTSGSRSFIKISGNNIQETIASIQGTYEKFEKDQPFSYKFLDDEFNAFYKNVQTVEKLSTIFAGIAIFVSCLGLFGLAGYMSEQRKKETGIRRVMGASSTDLTLLFSKDFVKLVFISFAIACPIAWYLANDWLKEFSYRITPSASIFVLAGVMAVIIALLTVSYHTIKSSFSNPVNSLRYE